MDQKNYGLTCVTTFGQRFQQIEVKKKKWKTLCSAQAGVLRPQLLDRGGGRG